MFPRLPCAAIACVDSNPSAVPVHCTREMGPDILLCCDRYEKLVNKPFTLSEASYVVCHAPYNKVLPSSEDYTWRLLVTGMVLQSLLVKFGGRQELTRYAVGRRAACAEKLCSSRLQRLYKKR